jgi:HlyD family secretion protein
MPGPPPGSRFRGKWIALSGAATVVALAGVAVWMRAPAKKTQAAPVAAPASAVREANLTGKIRPQQVVSVTAPVEGVIGAFFVEAGQEVFEGQLLARLGSQSLDEAQQGARREMEAAQSHVNTLESEIIAARLEASRAQADASRARSEYERLDKIYQRQKMLFAEGATPKLAFDKAEREFQTAQGELNNYQQVASDAEERVKEILKRLDAERKTLQEKSGELDSAKAQSGATEVVSPVQGLVVTRNGEVGQTIAPDKGDFFQNAVHLSELEVVVDGDPAALSEVRAGQPALVILPDQGGEGIPGSVRSVSATQAVVAFSSPNPAIKPGMPAQVRIRLQ